LTRFIEKAKSLMSVGGKAMRSPKDILTPFVHVRLFNPSRSKGWALLIAVAVVALLGACATVKIPEPTDRVTASAEILGTQIVVRSEGTAKWHYFDFNVPKAGSATLRLSNGAKTGASLSERMLGTKVSLNGQGVVSCPLFFWLYDTLDVPVELQAGPNRLGVQLYTVSGKRLSAYIHAVADRVDLQPLAGPLIAGAKSERAIAKVTALGEPVPDARVLFEAIDIEGIKIAGGTTGTNGRAFAIIGARGESGVGVLRATVKPDTGQPLNAEVPLKVIGQPAIVVEQDVETVAVKVSSETSLRFAVNVRRPPEGQSYTVTLNQSVEPSNRGLALWTGGYPVEGWTTDTPSRFVVNEILYGVSQGTYTITTTATIMETGQSDTAVVVVNVVPANTPDPLVLYTPSSDPPAIPPSPERTTVTFRSIVAGSKTPPEVLFLDEVDEKGVRLHTVATLRDEDEASDFIYAGTAEIGSANETQKRYRARAEFFGRTVTSDVYTFRITELPLVLEPSDPTKFVEDPKTGARFISNELLVTFLPGVSSDRIEDIVSAENARIAGYIPILNILKIVGVGDGTPEGGRAALARFLAYDEVAFAELNYEVVPTGVPGDLTDCSLGTESDCQWNMYKIRADLAWLLGRGSENIAILDTGVAYNHPDLTANILREGGNVVGDDFVTGPSEHDPSDESSISHGTHVAGIAAASTNNAMDTVAGISWDSKIQAVRILPGNRGGFYAAIQYVVTQNKARIINFSNDYGPFDDPDMNALNAVDVVFDNGKFVVSAAGDTGDDTRNLPGYYNMHPDFTVSGTTNNGIMAVASTTIDDQLQSISTYGSWVEIAAPGDNIYSTKRLPPNDTSYGTLSGASMASPHVAGAVAFLWSLNPDWNRSQIEQELKASAALVTLSSGQTLDVDGGRLDLLAAVFGPGMRYYSNATETTDVITPGLITNNQTVFGWTTGTTDPADPVGTAQSTRDFLIAKKDGPYKAPEILEAVTHYNIPSGTLPAHSGNIVLNSGLDPDDRLLIVTTPLFPKLRVDTPFQRLDAFGNLVWEFPLLIDNWEEFPAEFFVSRPDLPPCGLNTNASRTWIGIFNALTDQRTYGFCALTDLASLKDKLWFGILVGETPPTQVYIKVWVRDTGEPFTDQNSNYQYDPGEPFTDQNGNGQYDAGELYRSYAADVPPLPPSP